jgi:ATP-dependent Lhr-like helicase
MFSGDSLVGNWFKRRYPNPTPAQVSAHPHLMGERHVLIVSPTGTGKTLAAFLHVLDELARTHEAGTLPDTLQALYISPLRALTYDLEKNLKTPLHEIYGDTPPIRVGVRTGDTDPSERQRQRNHPPHILLTTPETLCLLLSQPRWIAHLAQVRWVIVDEIHALLGTKRGAHLSVSMERLTHLVGRNNRPQRIGLSATVAPLEEAAAFLGGSVDPEDSSRAVQIVDVHPPKLLDLRVYTPLQSNPYPKAGFTGVRLTRELSQLIRKHTTTLIFTNTRSGAESTTYWLHQALPDLRNQIECHHGSLDRDLRLDVEDRLKQGKLRAVVSSSSLELGVDIGSIDLVVMLATPKGVSKALQRTGRAGHRIDAVSRGLLMATNIGDLVECCATARLARAGHLDPIRIPDAPLDVLAQHLVSMGCIQEWRRDDALKLVRNARPYRDLAESDFVDVLNYLAGGGESLQRQYTELFGKIHLDPDTFEARAGSVRRDFLQNIGTIPSEGMVRVFQGRTQLGAVEEGFMRRLKLGDVFALAGRPIRLDRVGNMECWVSPAPGSLPTIPRWGANKFPLSNRVAHAIRDFREGLKHEMDTTTSFVQLTDWIADHLECDRKNAGAILHVHAAQRSVSEIPTHQSLLVEEWVEEPLPNVLGSEPVTPVNSPASKNPTNKGYTTRLNSLRSFRTPPKRPFKNPAPADVDDSPGGQLAMASILFPQQRQPSSPSPSSSRADHGQPTVSNIPTGDRCRYYFFHSLIGRAANDALSRVIGLRVGRLLGGNPVVTADDYGFVLTLAPGQALDTEWLPSLFSAEEFSLDLETVLRRSQLLQYHFRSAAQTGLMVYRTYFGQQKSVKKLQWSAEVLFNVLIEHEPQHVLLREARRDAADTFLDAPTALAYLNDLILNNRPIRLRSVQRVPPLSFGMYATRIQETLLVEDPREALERLYHHWWNILEPTTIQSDQNEQE